ncbi:MAG: hypothetical protein LBU19_05555 [Treponema sp.]|jgi:hypothetical protein|nr:hypothetical protein [Treponema sp.]
MTGTAKTPAGPAKSSGSYGIFTGIVISALVILAVFVVSRLEIYEREKWAPSSRELRFNNFYLLGEWLSASGHPVRFSPRWDGVKDISPQEGGLFIQASLFDWEREDILPWVREGGVLVISIDFPWYRMNGAEEEAPPAFRALEKFLEKLDIRIRPPEKESFDIEAEDAPDEGEGGDNRTGEDDADNGADTFFDEEDEDEDSIAEEDESPAFPDYDYSVSFEDSDFTSGDFTAAEGPDRRFLTLRDSEGDIRLIRAALGEGLIAVTGSCVFMYNYCLDDEINARLAWALTGGSLKPERPAFLFIRGRQGSEGLWGILNDWGDLLPPVISALVLVFIGFWMVLPGFGVPQREESRRRLSITGRFSAEARFFRRYDALEAYLEIYLRELRRRARGRALGREIEEVEKVLAAGKRIGPIKTAVYLKNLMSALERI